MAASKPFILVVEDEKELADLVTEQLESADMQIQVHNNGSNVIHFLSRNFVNLVLMDVGLPDTTGFDLLSEMRKQGIEVPVIFLTANESEQDKVRGLERGADDYVTKPFNTNELVARIHAVLRRTETANDTKVTKNTSLTEEPFEFCGATINPTRMEASFPNSETMKLGRKELGILSYMAANPHAVQSRRSLIHAVWGVHADVRSRSLDQYIVKIRENFTKQGCDLENFRTIHGVGYLYDPARENLTSN